MIPIGSGAETRFGSRSSVYTASDPAVAAWGAPGAGLYTIHSSLPGLPTAPVPIQHPISASFGHPFQTTSSASVFDDPLTSGTSAFTTATSVIASAYNSSPTRTDDARVIFPQWSFTQGSAALGYAYEQVNFAADYFVSFNTLGLAAVASASPYTFTVSGNTVNAASYAQIDATFTYTWQPTTGGTAAIHAGSPVALGSLQYAFSTTGLTSFSSLLVPVTGSLLATPAGDGVLEITGYAYIAGDPFSLTMHSVTTPEPTTLSLIGVTAILVFRRSRR